jgi:hypothetical protein
MEGTFWSATVKSLSPQSSRRKAAKFAQETLIKCQKKIFTTEVTVDHGRLNQRLAKKRG